MDTRSKGTAGEELAVKFLKKHGYRIICRNFRTKAGEIDIIARDGRTTVFVEVKLRENTAFGYPEEGVIKTKITHLKKAALSYLIQKGISDTPCRFEVVSILKEGDGYRIDLLPLEL